MDLLSKKIAETKQAVIAAEEQLVRNEAAMAAAAEKYQETERYLSRLKTELQAYEDADRLRPVGYEPDPNDHATAVVTGTKHKGRKPGSISIKWRQALSDLVSAGNRPVDQQQFYLLTRGRLGLAEASVRERLRQYAAAGFLIETGGRYVVSDFAIRQWRLDIPQQDNSGTPEITYPRQVGGADNEKAPH
jgi:hypothetical protein